MDPPWGILSVTIFTFEVILATYTPANNIWDAQTIYILNNTS